MVKNYSPPSAEGWVMLFLFEYSRWENFRELGIRNWELEIGIN